MLSDQDLIDHGLRCLTTHPDKVDFYTIGNLKKICELDISDFNSDDAKYITLKRSSLIKILKKGIEDDVIKFTHNNSKIN